MDRRRRRPVSASIAVLFSWMALLLPPLQAGGFESAEALAPQLQAQAEQLEEAAQWRNASDLWYQALLKNRSSTYARQHYQYCLRRAQQVTRHQDATYREQIANLSLENALQLYADVLTKLQADYVDAAKVQLPLLCKQGLNELRFALTDPGLRQAYFTELAPESVRDFLLELQTAWSDKPLRKVADAQNLARDLALAVKKSLGLKPSLVVLELACGACNALDECTYYLTPGQYKELDASLKGEAVGIGVEVAAQGDKVFISQVLPGSPAQLNGLNRGDEVVRIGNKSGLTLVDAAAGLLRGEPETVVELEVRAAGEMNARTLKLKRQVVRVPSVSEPALLDTRYGIGYVQLLGFQETTVEELNQAIAKLQEQGARVLVLDLRGNPGGLFEVARQVVERFVSAGVIVSTQGRVASEFNATYHAHGLNTLTLPLVVLVDSETASSAEMVAGALKDNLRGKLVGKTTFGKGSLQKIKGVGSFQAGIRMTVARFYSPRQQAYDGIGVAPHLEVEFRPPSMSMSMQLDSQVQAAVEVARSLVLGQRPDGEPN